MSKKLFHIRAYYFGEEMPTEYPVPLHIEECEVDSSERVNDFYNKECKPSSESADGGFFCMRVQENEKNESGGLMRRDDEIRMGCIHITPMVVTMRVGVSRMGILSR